MLSKRNRQAKIERRPLKHGSIARTGTTRVRTWVMGRSRDPGHFKIPSDNHYTIAPVDGVRPAVPIREFPAAALGNEFTRTVSIFFSRFRPRRLVRACALAGRTGLANELKMGRALFPRADFFFGLVSVGRCRCRRLPFGRRSVCPWSVFPRPSVPIPILIRNHPCPPPASRTRTGIV